MSMKRQVMEVVSRVLGRANMCATPQTPVADVATLVQRLRPVAPGIDLRRLGPAGDGGYLVPDDLDGIVACFSPGVSTISGFEEDCAALGMQVFLADASVQSPAVSHERFVFTRKYVGATSSDLFMTMDEWVEASLAEKESDLLLQIDIEGAEYETFLSMSPGLLQRFRIIVAEFHGMHSLWSRPFHRLGATTFDKILQTHTCVHLHPNNCCGSVRNAGIELPRVMEFTFLRSDRVLSRRPATTFPHPLDSDNTPQRSLDLPPCWYGGAT